MKKILLSFLFLLSILIVAVLFIPFSVFKEDALHKLNQQSNYQFSVKELNYQLINPGSLELLGLVMTDEKGELLKAKKVEVELDLFELFQKVINIEKALIYGLEFKLDKKRFEKRGEEKPVESKSEEIPVQKIQFQKVGILNSNLEFDGVILKDLSLLFTDGNLTNLKQIPESLKTKLQINAESIQKGEYKVEQFEMKGTLAHNTLKIFPEGLFLGEKFEAELSQNLNFKEEELKNSLKFKLEKFDLQNLSKLEAVKKYPVTGALEMNVEAQYNMTGQYVGDISVQSQGIQIENIDLDELINTFKNSQKVTLGDAVGFYALGPIGLLYSQGVNVGKSIPGAMGGKSSIKQLNIDVKLNNQKLSLEDVAVRTKENLIAARGDINLKNKKFKNLKIGFLNKKYCPELIQKVEGTLDKPEFDLGKSVLKTLAAPVTSLLNSSKELVTGCKRFYSGKVQY